MIVSAFVGWVKKHPGGSFLTHQWTKPALAVADWVDVVFFQQLAQGAAFLLRLVGCLRHIALGVGDEPSQVVLFEIFNGLVFRLVKGRVEFELLPAVKQFPP